MSRVVTPKAGPLAQLSDPPLFHLKIPGTVLVLLDQAVVSSGNFVTGILLGRWLSSSQYGNYGLLIETLLFFNSLQSAVINYPLTIRVASRDDDARHCSTAGLGLTVLFLPLLAVGLYFATSLTSGMTIAIYAVATMLFWQTQETLRRVMIADGRLAECLPGDLLSYWGQAIGIAALHTFGRLDLPGILLIIGGTSALATLVQVAQIGLSRISLKDLLRTAASFWELGKWSLLACLIGCLSSVSLLWVLRIRHGADAVGAFVAIAALLKLSNPLTFAIASLVTPGVARLAHRNSAAATRFACSYGAIGLAILLPYYLALLICPSATLQLIYGARSVYPRDASTLQCMVLFSALVYAGGVLGAWLGGLRMMRQVLYSQVAQCILAVAVAVPLTLAWGVPGLILGNIITMSGGVAVAGYALVRAIRKSDLDDDIAADHSATGADALSLAA